MIFSFWNIVHWSIGRKQEHNNIRKNIYFTVFSAHQGCIYFLENAVKTVKLSFYLNI